MLASLTDFVLANPAEQITQAVQSWVGPIFLLIIGIIALTFLFRREIMQFVIFIIIAILVAILFYAPGVVKGIAQSFTGDANLKEGSW